jgi:uncharacterized protein (TIGR02265 family)
MDAATSEPTKKPSGFFKPDMTKPLNLFAAQQQCPEAAHARGMFFADIVAEMKAHKLPLHSDKVYVPFSNYPQREFLALAHYSAQKLYPHVPVREALRLLGQSAYPTFARSMIGRVMFGVLRHDVQAIMKIAPRGYQAVLSLGRSEILSVGDDHVHMRMTDVHTFLDSYQVGVVEGAVMACGRLGTVEVRMKDTSNGELWVSW